MPSLLERLWHRRSWSGPCPSMADYVAMAETRGETLAAAGCLKLLTLPEHPARHHAPADPLGVPTDTELERLSARVTAMDVQLRALAIELRLAT